MSRIRSPGGLMKTEMAGPHPQSFWLSRSLWCPSTGISKKFPIHADAAGPRAVWRALAPAPPVTMASSSFQSLSTSHPPLIHRHPPHYLNFQVPYHTMPLPPLIFTPDFSFTWNAFPSWLPLAHPYVYLKIQFRCHFFQEALQDFSLTYLLTQQTGLELLLWASAAACTFPPILLSPLYHQTWSVRRICISKKFSGDVGIASPRITLEETVQYHMHKILKSCLIWA